MKHSRVKFRGARRGTVYLVVLSTAGVVTVLSLTGMALVRAQRRVSEATIAMMEARAAAMSGIEHAAALLDATSTWRTTAQSHSGRLATIAIGRCAVALTAADPGGQALSGWALKPVEVTARATIGQTVQAYKAQITQEYSPLSCLGAALAVKGPIEIEDTVVAATERITCNDAVDAVACRVWAPVEAVGWITGASYYSTTSTKGARTMPGSSVFSQYTTAGEEIRLADITSQTIENIVLGPDSNPYAKSARTTNTTGVFWVDCASQNITIRNCRIVGTLVLVNAGRVTLEGSLNMTPTVRGLPVLLVQGKVRCSTRRAALSESAIGVNLNPSQVPIDGVSNNTTSDKYPSVLGGLVYASDEFQVLGDLAIEGQLICGGTFRASGSSVVITYDNGSYISPPPGFSTSSGARVLAGTVEQMVFP